MIVVGVCAGPTDKFENIAAPGIRRSFGDEATVICKRNQRSICEAYNSILDEATAMDGLEAVVFIHDDVELMDPAISEKITSTFLRPGVGLVGVIGAQNVRDMRWHLFDGRGTAQTSSGTLCYEPVTDFVDTIDGIFMAVSPKVAKAVRFDERTFPGFHGYDADYSAAVRAAGWTVMVTPIELFHFSTGAKKLPELRCAILRWRIKWRTDASRLRRLDWRLRLLLRETDSRLSEFPLVSRCLFSIKRLVKSLMGGARRHRIRGADGRAPRSVGSQREL